MATSKKLPFVVRRPAPTPLRSSAPFQGVRKAQPADADALAWIQTLAWQVALEQKHVPSAPAAIDPSLRAARWARRLTASDMPVFLAIWNKQPAGYLALAPLDVACARIASAQVHPLHWSGRVWSSLSLAACDWLANHGYQELELSVPTEHVEVQHALTRDNFRFVGSCWLKGRMHNTFRRRALFGA